MAYKDPNYQKNYHRKPRTEEQKSKRLAGGRLRYRQNPTKHTFGKGAGAYFAAQLEIQKHCCAICDTAIDMHSHLDHDHKKAKNDPESWRGALCRRCNQGIGWFEDSPALLANAIAYLNSWKKVQSLFFAAM